MNLVQRLRKAVRGSRLSLYAVAKGAEIDYAALHRFMAQQRDIRLETASKLAGFLGLDLTSKKKKVG